jgi:hypothetical protein
MNIGSFLNRHLAGKPDYLAQDSLVNKARRGGLSKPLVGAGVGAAVGGTAGFLWGANNLSKDQVSVVTRTEEITRPVLVGAAYDDADSYTTTYTTTDSDGNTQYHTQWHYEPEDWDPIIRHQGTGQYDQKKVFQHSSSFGPLTGLAVGAGAGALVGALVTSLTNLVQDELPRHSWDKPRVPETAEKQTLARQADKAPLVGTVAGALVGAGAGAWAGSLAAERNQSIEQVYQQPVYETRTIGYIPSNHQTRTVSQGRWGDFRVMYDELPENFQGSPRFSNGGEAVRRSVFTGRYQPVQLTSNSHWLTPAKGAAIGAGLGAVTGLLTGVAGGILMKIASGEQASHPLS